MLKGNDEKAASPPSPWDFASIAELAKALRSRKVSASELLDHTIARVEALDRRINAVVVRDFDRARMAAKMADAALARGEHRALLGVAVTLEEPFNGLGLSKVQGFCADRRCARRRAVEAGWRHHHWQDQYPDRASRVPELQRDLRNHQQSLRSRPLARRLLGRIGRGACGRIRSAFAGI